jgi:hypothetical protein
LSSSERDVKNLTTEDTKEHRGSSLAGISKKDISGKAFDTVLYMNCLWIRPVFNPLAIQILAFRIEFDVPFLITQHTRKAPKCVKPDTVFSV